MANEQKIPLTRTLPRVADRQVTEEFAKRGTPMPCHVISVQWPLVTVNFDVADALLPPVQVAPVCFQYANVPIQVGEKGWVFPCPLFMGGVTGQGPADKLASFDEPQFNLSALMFFPASNTNWAPPGNTNAQTLWGPEGVVIQDEAGSSPAASVTVQAGAVAVKANAVEITSDVGISGGLTVGTGASGSFTTPTGQTVTVQDGIVTNIF